MNTSLDNFFDDVTIFITGGSGFIGNVLIEKLLRSQTNIRKLYLLIRSKAGKSSEERARAKIFDKVIFEQLRETHPDFMKKVAIVSGDMLKPELGLSEIDKKLIFNEVNIMFNCAASINMNATLKKSLECNVTSLIEVLNLCRGMKNLKSLVVVSTVYSNCNRSVIEERICSSPISPELAYRLCSEVDNTTLEKIVPLIRGGHPNCYTLSKSLAENVLLSYNDLPIVLFRPAIVVASYREPLPGWVDNLNGPTGIIYGSSMGILRCSQYDPNVKSNIVPVDMCVNAMIVASWHGTRSRLNLGDQVPTYNYAFDRKKWKLGKYFDFMITCDIKLNQAIWKPVYIITNNPSLYIVLKFFLHTIPAFFIDTLLALYGSRFRLGAVFEKKIYPALNAFHFFNVNEWEIKEDNTNAMWKSLQESERNRYLFDSGSVFIKEWLRIYGTGVKAFICKERMEDNHIALRRHKILTLIHYTSLFVLFSCLVWIFQKAFRYFQ